MSCQPNQNKYFNSYCNIIISKSLKKNNPTPGNTLSQIINYLNLTYFIDSFHRSKILQLRTTEDYDQSSMNDSSWKIILKYRINYPNFLKNQFKTTM